MEGVDSPLEVLSLAATMVQDSCLPPSYEEASVQVREEKLPSARWRKERRAHRLPDYGERSQCDAPLDMSTRARPSPPPASANSTAATPALRGSPPSYSEAISQSRPRPSVITCASQGSDTEQQKGTRKEFPTGDGISDPVIDEHFRRSLGKDYMNLFSKPKSDSCEPEQKEKGGDSELSITGLSVDDHFAKALGDTWLKLQAESNSAPSSRKTPFSIKTSKKSPPVTSTVTSKETTNASIPRQRRGVVTI